MDFNSPARLVRAFRPSPYESGDPDVWPATVPAAGQLLRDGLELPSGITILVGENGSGKSTVVEMMAEAYGLNPQGGSILAPHARVRESEPHAGHRLIVEREPTRHAWAYFLRADTMHSLYTYLEENPSWTRPPERLHELSHGEGFLRSRRLRSITNSDLTVAQRMDTLRVGTVTERVYQTVPDLRLMEETMTVNGRTASDTWTR